MFRDVPDWGDEVIDLSDVSEPVGQCRLASKFLGIAQD